jgi:hypothetical protein
MKCLSVSMSRLLRQGCDVETFGLTIVTEHYRAERQFHKLDLSLSDVLPLFLSLMNRRHVHISGALVLRPHETKAKIFGSEF